MRVNYVVVVFTVHLRNATVSSPGVGATVVLPRWAGAAAEGGHLVLVLLPGRRTVQGQQRAAKAGNIHPYFFKKRKHYFFSFSRSPFPPGTLSSRPARPRSTRASWRGTRTRSTSHRAPCSTSGTTRGKSKLRSKQFPECTDKSAFIFTQHKTDIWTSSPGS